MSPPVQYHHSLTPVFLLIGIAGFILSIWLGPWLYQKRPWEMVCVPIVLLVIVVVVMPVSAPVMMVGTFPVLMIDSIIAYRRPQLC